MLSKAFWLFLYYSAIVVGFYLMYSQLDIKSLIGLSFVIVALVVKSNLFTIKQIKELKDGSC